MKTLKTNVKRQAIMLVTFSLIINAVIAQKTNPGNSIMPASVKSTSRHQFSEEGLSGILNRKIFIGGNDSIVNKHPSVIHKYYIERMGPKKFRLDSSEVVKTHRVNQILSESSNPTVAVDLKVAKMMRLFHTFSKISAFPGTIGGAFASFATVGNLIRQLKAGPASFKDYFNAGLSLVGTVTLPITSKILKKKQDKLYDKAIGMYDYGN